MNKEGFSLESKTDWVRLDAMDDSDIDFSDLPELSDAQLQAMRPTRQFFAELGIQYNPQSLYRITVYHEDESVSTHQVTPHGNVVVLDLDRLRYFPDSASVNRTPRALIELIPQL